MSLVPDWISKEDFARALFLVLGAAVGATVTLFKDALGGIAQLLTHWIRGRLQTTKSVVIVQDFVGLGAENLWHIVPFQGRDTMHFVGRFQVTNSTDRPLTFTRVECDQSRSRVFHVRAENLSETHRGGTDFPVAPQSIAEIRLGFGLNPAPPWTGEQRLTLRLRDSAGVRRKVKATFSPVAAPAPGAAPSSGHS
jgi:hypothetical protein